MRISKKLWILAVIVVLVVFAANQKMMKKEAEIITTYQENPDEYLCGGFTETECSLIFDNDWDTYTDYYGSGTILTGHIYYYKPSGSLSTSKWEVRDDAGWETLDLLPACWDAYPEKVELTILNSHTLNEVRWYCFDGSYQQIIRKADPGSRIYEERMIWDIDAYQAFLGYKSDYLDGGSFSTFISDANSWVNS